MHIEAHQQQMMIEMRNQQHLAEQAEIYRMHQMNAANAGQLPPGTVGGSSKDGSKAEATKEEKSDKGATTLDTAPVEKDKAAKELKKVANTNLKGSTQTTTLEKLKQERATKRALMDAEEALEEEMAKDVQALNSKA